MGLTLWPWGKWILQWCNGPVDLFCNETNMYQMEHSGQFQMQLQKTFKTTAALCQRSHPQSIGKAILSMFTHSTTVHFAVLVRPAPVAPSCCGFVSFNCPWSVSGYHNCLSNWQSVKSPWWVNNPSQSTGSELKFPWTAFYWSLSDHHRMGGVYPPDSHLEFVPDKFWDLLSLL